jgi:hypothetical protein
MAMPYVSGVAGLMLSVAPTLSAESLKSKLIIAANDIGTTDQDSSGKPSKPTPLRILDACRSVKAASNIGDPSAPKLDYPTGQQIPGSIGLDGKRKFDISFRWDTNSFPESCNALRDYEFSLTLDGTPYVQADFCTASWCSTGSATTWSDVIRNPPKLTGWGWVVRAVDIYEHRGVSSAGTFRLASVVDDNFNDNFLDPTVWKLQDGIQGTVEETNQRLEMTPTGPTGTGVGISSRWFVSGDFDIQVDYTLLSWPEGVFKNVQIKAVDLPRGAFGPTSLARNGFPTEVYVLDLGISFLSIPTTDMSGTLRLVRTGSTLSGYVRNGASWIPVGSGTTSTGPTRISLESSPGAGTAGVLKIAFDNFRVTSGTIQ